MIFGVNPCLSTLNFSKDWSLVQKTANDSDVCVCVCYWPSHTGMKRCFWQTVLQYHSTLLYDTPGAWTRLEPGCCRLPRSGIRGRETERERCQCLENDDGWWWLESVALSSILVCLLVWLRKRQLNPLMSLMGLSVMSTNGLVMLNMYQIYSAVCKYLESESESEK